LSYVRCRIAGSGATQTDVQRDQACTRMHEESELPSQCGKGGRSRSHRYSASLRRRVIAMNSSAAAEEWGVRLQNAASTSRSVQRQSHEFRAYEVMKRRFTERTAKAITQPPQFRQGRSDTMNIRFSRNRHESSMLRHWPALWADTFHLLYLSTILPTQHALIVEPLTCNG
jgi:hypothetical protein